MHEKVLHVPVDPETPAATFNERMWQISKDPNPFNIPGVGKKTSKTLGG